MKDDGKPFNPNIFRKYTGTLWPIWDGVRICYDNKRWHVVDPFTSVKPFVGYIEEALKHRMPLVPEGCKVIVNCPYIPGRIFKPGDQFDYVRCNTLYLSDFIYPDGRFMPSSFFPTAIGLLNLVQPQQTVFSYGPAYLDDRKTGFPLFTHKDGNEYTANIEGTHLFSNYRWARDMIDNQHEADAYPGLISPKPIGMEARANVYVHRDTVNLYRFICMPKSFPDEPTKEQKKASDNIKIKVGSMGTCPTWTRHWGRRPSDDEIIVRWIDHGLFKSRKEFAIPKNMLENNGINT